MTYHGHLRKSYIPMLLSRTIPVAGITVLFSLVANISTTGLVLFAYTLAMFTILTALTSMCLGATGNIIARPFQDQKKAQEIFSSGLCLAALLCAVGTAVALMLASIVKFLPGGQLLEEAPLRWMAIIYISCIPFTVINTFLHIFHESSGSALNCTKIRTLSTVSGLCFLLASSRLVDKDIFVYLAMSYFVVTETISFYALRKLTTSKRLTFTLVFDRTIIRQTLSLGLPIAVGLAGQKFYFYLLNERLASLNLQLVAELAVFMTLAGLLLIPYTTLSQAHSLYVSKFPGSSLAAYGRGIIGHIILSTLLSTAILMNANRLFSTIGDTTLPASNTLVGALISLIFCNGLLSLAMAHLRGMNDTLKPQLLVNIVFFTALTPLLYSITPEPLTLPWYINLQAIALLCIWVILTFRIFLLHHRSRSTLCSVQ
ncbi:hypothetical protein [Pseudomonas sp. UBA4194]|uniref:hypothetical protein n=1 Tax=Pseudomonas sp. UBA4194 TaxID=1947317 RepID=UPI0025F3551B|nr:hypothetical protein [Pseudomonas sp. UBA4194]